MIPQKYDQSRLVKQLRSDRPLRLHKHERRSLTKQLPSGVQFQFHKFTRKFTKINEEKYSNMARKQIWKAYVDLKKSGIEEEAVVLPLISDLAWTKLWESQLSYGPTIPRRLLNLEMLIRDMQSVSRDTVRHLVTFEIEKKLTKGLIEEAFIDWINAPYGDNFTPQAPLRVQANNEQMSLTTAPTPAFEVVLAAKNFDESWLQLGARISAAARRSDHVMAITEQLEHRFHTFDPQFAVYVIQHLNDKPCENNVQKAWSILNSMVRAYGFKPPFADFEAIFFSFLSAPNVPYAAAILCFMTSSYRTSKRRATHIFDRLLNELFCSCETLDDVDQISLVLIEHLPGGTADDKFFDNWLKQSSRTGNHNHTATIIELMFRTVKAPKAYHIDRLLHSFIKFAGPQQASQAESLALAMIQKQLRSANTASNAQDAGHDVDLSVVPSFMRQRLPAADARTYVQLMGYYASRGESESTRQVLRFLTHLSDLRLNNQIIRAILSVHFTMGDPQGAWSFFQTVTLDDEYEGCVRTYAVLWKGLHLYLSGKKTANMLDYPGPRALFNRMINDLTAQHGTWALPFPEQLPDTMYERIVQCFCLAEDTPGVLLAIHGMKDLFDADPTPDTVVTIVKHLTHRDIWQATPDNKRDFIETYFKEYAGENADLLEAIWQRIQNRKAASSVSRSTASNARKLGLRRSQEKLDLVSDHEILLLVTFFVKAYARRNRGLGIRLRDALDNARFEMGFDRFSDIHDRMGQLRDLVS